MVIGLVMQGDLTKHSCQFLSSSYLYNDLIIIASVLTQIQFGYNIRICFTLNFQWILLFNYLPEFD